MARCGKSTFCKKLKEEKYVIVSDDAIRLAVYRQRYNLSREPEVFAVKYPMITALLNNGHKVVADDTHTTSDSILKILKIDPHANFVFFDQPLYKCKQRAEQTKQLDLLPVLDRMYCNLTGLFGDFTTSTIVNTINKLRLEAAKTKEKEVIEYDLATRVVTSL